MPEPAKNKSRAAIPAPENLAVAILAAGKGTRLKSKHPKVLHAIAGKTLLEHVIAAASRVVAAQNIYVVIGYEAESVRRAVRDTGVKFVLQPQQRGTGDAIMATREVLSRFKTVLVLSGDVPLVEPATLRGIVDFHLKKQAAMTLFAATVPDPAGYGRVIRARHGSEEVLAIVEEKALRGKQQQVREVNSGIYAFDAQALFANIDRLQTNNPHREFYLTDMAAVLRKEKRKVVAITAEEPQQAMGANTRAELARLDSILRQRKTSSLMQSGVTIFRPETSTIDSDVEAGEDTSIEPFVQILGKTRIGSNCRIASFSIVRDCEIADSVEIRPGCVLTGARVHREAVIGPYAHVRAGSEIGERAHVGNFVELKKTKLGKGSKAGHLAYLGDSQIGEGVNIGAGTITCNYDGAQKHSTVIEDGAFIGSDSTLVAPVQVGAGAYVAAGSCVTQDVPADALAIARGRQVNKEHWVTRRRVARATAQPGK